MPILLFFNCIFVAAIVPISQLKLNFMESSFITDVQSLSETLCTPVFVVYCTEYDRCRILGVFDDYQHAKRIYDAHREVAPFYQNYRLDVYDLIKG